MQKVYFSEKYRDAHGRIFGTRECTIVAPENSYMESFANFYNTKYNTTVASFESDGTVAKEPVLFFYNAGNNAFMAIYQITDSKNVIEISGTGDTKNFVYISDKYKALDDGDDFTPTYYIRYNNGGANFQELKDVKTLNVREAITGLGNFLFYSCLQATEVNLSPKITRIGWRVFNFCQNIKRVEIPEGTTVIDDLAFMDATRLEYLVIPDSVTTFGKDLFKNCRLSFVDGTQYKVTATFKTNNEAFIE